MREGFTSEKIQKLHKDDESSLNTLDIVAKNSQVTEKGGESGDFQSDSFRTSKRRR